MVNKHRSTFVSSPSNIQIRPDTLIHCEKKLFLKEMFVKEYHTLSFVFLFRINTIPSCHFLIKADVWSLIFQSILCVFHPLVSIATAAGCCSDWKRWRLARGCLLRPDDRLNSGLQNTVPSAGHSHILKKQSNNNLRIHFVFTTFKLFPWFNSSKWCTKTVFDINLPKCEVRIW